MIVCQCNIISERDIEDAVLELLEQDEWQLIVPMQVYHLLGRRGRCCGCFPNTMEVIVRTVEAYHFAKDNPAADVISLVAELRERQQEQNMARERSPTAERGPVSRAG